LSNKILPMPAAHRRGKSALDEFLPEADLRLHSGNNGSVHLDPREVHLEPVVAPPSVGTVADPSRVQWWPMFAAALVGIGVSLLAFGAWARFGQF
jgi:hypothetical protein